MKEQEGSTPDHLPLGYLRTFVVLLVLAHHAVLAYHPHAPAPLASLGDEPRWWQAFPVLDAQRSELVALFAGWNDIFFMALLFFVSGLFVFGSLARTGAAHFLGRRLRRLGLPFLALALVVAPLAYYPAYLATAQPEGIAGFAREWLTLGNWPAGPAWFLWLLLAFDALAAGLFVWRSQWATALGRKASGITSRPLPCFTLFVAITALAYMPLTYGVGPLHWFSIGPFALQTSRLLFYLAYFLGGVVLGAQGLDRGLLAPDGLLARRWAVWVSVAPTTYVFAVGAYLATLTPGAGAGVRLLASFAFVVCSAASCFALLALFLRFAKTPRPVFDRLRENAYGMYVVHYALVSWLQVALLGVSLPALGKASVVVLSTIFSSWAVAAGLRTVPAIRRTV